MQKGGSGSPLSWRWQYTKTNKQYINAHCTGVNDRNRPFCVCLIPKPATNSQVNGGKAFIGTMMSCCLRSCLKFQSQRYWIMVHLIQLTVTYCLTDLKNYWGVLPVHSIGLNRICKIGTKHMKITWGVPQGSIIGPPLTSTCSDHGKPV